MNPLIAAAATVTAIGTIGGGALALDKLHVAAAEFEQYLEQQQVADEREYVRDLKKDIRDVKAALLSHPDDEFLLGELADLMDELCEIRPDDRLCSGQ